MSAISSKDIRRIYDCLADRESRVIFANRLLYSLTSDTEYIRNVIVTTEEGSEFYHKLTKDTRKKLIFGSGIWGKEIVNTYREFHFECFVDNKIKGEDGIYCNLPVISFEKYLKDYKEGLIIISSRLYHGQIYRQLKENGVKEEQIVNAGKMIDDMSRRQYFDLPALNARPWDGKGGFVDAGSFDGRTSVLFSEWCQGNYSHIWAFEPDKENVEKCQRTLRGLGGSYDIITSGLWDEKSELRFTAESNGGSKVEASGEEKIHVGRLDDLVQGKVGFIKMDIEGSEEKALRGG